MTKPKRPRDRRNLFRYFYLVTFCYIALSLLGITTSHLGALFGSADESTSQIFGEFRHQRSDEFLRGSPRVVASLRGIDHLNYTPLDFSGSFAFQEQQDSFLAKVNLYTTPVHIVLAEKLAIFLPLDMGFALLWWLNTWVLFIALPLWFYLLGRRAYLGGLCALAIFFSPPNNWFSYLPSTLIAQTVLSSCFLIIGMRMIRSKSWTCVPGAVIFGVYSGRLAFTVVQYPPWGIPVLFVIGMGTLFLLLDKRPITRALRDLSVFLVIGSLATAVVYFFNQKLYAATLDTVYPGQRREAGGNGDQGLWSGGLAWFFQSTFARRGNFTNPEIIMGPTFVVIPAIFAYFRQELLGEINGWLKRAVGAGLTICLILLCWSQFHWPDWALKFNPLVFIPSARADQILGVVVLIPLFLLVSSTENMRLRTGTVLLMTAVTVGISSRDMQSTQLSFLPGSETTVLTVSISLVAAITFSLLKFRHPIAKLSPLVAFLVISTATVNPVIRGLGALESSQAVSAMRELGKSAPNGRWATNGFYQDALMISTGVPQLSGQQPFGPNREVWRKIDTQNKFEDNWNRGQAYIQFAWDPRTEISIWNPSPDVIQVVISPCDSRLQDVQLQWVTSAAELDYQCLRKRRQVEWMGAPLFIYEILDISMIKDNNFDFST